ncbi:MAG: hypothetical protein VB144_07650 [Clostridia bacterium]|nr:hypothetical protein [Clostridia bacterium]
MPRSYSAPRRGLAAARTEAACIAAFFLLFAAIVLFGSVIAGIGSAGIAGSPNAWGVVRVDTEQVSAGGRAFRVELLGVALTVEMERAAAYARQKAAAP